MKIKAWTTDDMRHEGTVEFDEEEVRLLKKAAGIECWTEIEHRYSLFKCLRFLRKGHFLLAMKREEYKALIQERMLMFSFATHEELRRLAEDLKQLRSYLSFLYRLKFKDIVDRNRTEALIHPYL